jgi:hypothetical protein
MEIPHASLIQVKTGRDGKTITIEQDVLDIVKQIKEIDPRLSVHWNEFGGYFVIIEHCLDGAERLVTTVLELDNRILDHLRKIGSTDWDVGKELEKAEDAAYAAKEYAFSEEMGDKAEHLAHAIKKDLNVENKIFVPAGFATAR